MKSVEMTVRVIRHRSVLHPTNPNLDGWEPYSFWLHERFVKPQDRIEEGCEVPQWTIFWCSGPAVDDLLV